ncbi:sigma factor-like helix-turn-helix DNA-binding protein [Methylorubrum rhodesianum]|jgi:hypothetical protein|uniref:sigma factor-like helix-turn-helix DNA-binding protein n=1 Tax=Methylorubrum rhodesianum TaxID=29427 RepID=UPI003D090E05
MRAALDQLPIEQRKALVLVTVNGLSYDEAAVIVQYKVGTIKRRVSRVRLRHMELLAYSLGWPRFDSSARYAAYLGFSKDQLLVNSRVGKARKWSNPSAIPRRLSPGEHGETDT